jgi:hypothetical protein
MCIILILLLLSLLWVTVDRFGLISQFDLNRNLRNLLHSVFSYNQKSLLSAILTNNTMDIPAFVFVIVPWENHQPSSDCTKISSTASLHGEFNSWSNSSSPRKYERWCSSYSNSKNENPPSLPRRNLTMDKLCNLRCSSQTEHRSPSTKVCLPEGLVQKPSKVSGQN